MEINNNCYVIENGMLLVSHEPSPFDMVKIFFNTILDSKIQLTLSHANQSLTIVNYENFEFQGITSDLILCRTSFKNDNDSSFSFLHYFDNNVDFKIHISIETCDLLRQITILDEMWSIEEHESL